MVSCCEFVTRERAPVIRNFQVLFVITPFANVGHKEANVGDPLESLKVKLERFAEANDASTSELPHRILNITPRRNR
jgi:hypothetical protein